MPYLRRLLETAVVALSGGFLFHLAHIPLPWLLGTITSTMVWKFVLKRNIQCHTAFRSIALLILGFNTGSSFTKETGSLIVQHLPYMLLSTLLILGAAYFFLLLMIKLLKTDFMTSMLSSLPGGLSLGVILAQESKTANVSVVVFSQTIRVLAIIYTVPFLVVHVLGAKPLAGSVLNAGAAQAPNWYIPILFVLASLGSFWVLKKVRFPLPEMLGAVAGVIILIYCGLEPPVTPDIAVVIAQILMGISLTDSMKPGGLSNLRKLVPFTLLTSVVLILECMGIAYLLMVLTSLDFISAFLSVSAAGMPEMVLTGALVGANLPVIMAYQLFRILFVMIFIPPLVRRLMRVKRLRLEESAAE